ncbi:hypothetical protein [Allostreptomyces psammosilenae]|uniref:Uncharacterized protein n=1 Tax=Allostreptomyces psammosilenae TaxID=1892865 RepID=A0A853A3M9_9ACTN|nr:hypothetical protein [Allostreptomyces psammosilenae]NYI05112.1 hypothetical protein [Allostreptomyces psammosilenae]
MPMRTPVPPAGALNAVCEILDDPARVQLAGLRALLRPADAPLRPILPHPVFTLDPAAVRRGSGPEAAVAIGWRFLIASGSRVLAAAEAHRTADGYHFSHFAGGPFVASTERAWQQAAAVPEAAEGRYDLRMLYLPGSYSMALWLHRRDGAHEGRSRLHSTSPNGPGRITGLRGGQAGATGRAAGGWGADLLIPLAPAPSGVVPHRPAPAADLLPFLTGHSPRPRLAPPAGAA